MIKFKRIGGIEGKILRKYLKGRVVEPEDKPYLDRLARTGLISQNYDYGLKKPTAKTTKGGRSAIF